MINETFLPKVILDDINNDQKNELIIILTKAYGTGLHQQEIHILNSKNLTELVIEDAEQFIKNKAKSKIVFEDDKVNVTLTIDKERFEEV